MSDSQKEKLLMLSEQYGFVILEDDYHVGFYYSDYPLNHYGRCPVKDGVLVMPAPAFTGGKGKPGFQVNFGAVSAATLDEGLKRVGRILQAHLIGTYERAHNTADE